MGCSGCMLIPNRGAVGDSETDDTVVTWVDKRVRQSNPVNKAFVKVPPTTGTHAPKVAYEGAAIAVGTAVARLPAG